MKGIRKQVSTPEPALHHQMDLLGHHQWVSNSRSQPLWSQRRNCGPFTGTCLLISSQAGGGLGGLAADSRSLREAMPRSWALTTVRDYFMQSHHTPASGYKDAPISTVRLRGFLTFARHSSGGPQHHRQLPTS